MMRILILLVGVPFLWATPKSLQAQSEQEFKDFGDEVFIFLTDSSQSVSVELARLRVWREWIEQQEWTLAKKEGAKLDLQNDYGAHFQLFQREVGILQDRYFADLAEGADLKLYDYHFEASPDSSQYYQGTLYFIFEKGAMRSQARFHFPFIYHGRGFALLAAPREEF